MSYWGLLGLLKVLGEQKPAMIENMGWLETLKAQNNYADKTDLSDLSHKA